eukprot:m.270329 g.270329  ORF g.270329 m.270329 type:complete len:50 (+) comp38718_c0_seq1:196-345(+)
MAHGLVTVQGFESAVQPTSSPWVLLYLSPGRGAEHFSLRPLKVNNGITG